MNDEEIRKELEINLFENQDVENSDVDALFETLSSQYANSITYEKEANEESKECNEGSLSEDFEESEEYLSDAEVENLEPILKKVRTSDEDSVGKS